MAVSGLKFALRSEDAWPLKFALQSDEAWRLKLALQSEEAWRLKLALLSEHLLWWWAWSAVGARCSRLVRSELIGIRFKSPRVYLRCEVRA